jgi:hypothetical protein
MLRHVADQLPEWPKLATFTDDTETDVLSHFPSSIPASCTPMNPFELLEHEGSGESRSGPTLLSLARPGYHRPK